MEDLTPQLEALGRLAARGSDETADSEGVLALVRQSLASKLSRPPARRLPGALLLAAAVTMMAALLLLWTGGLGWRASGEEALAYAVRGTPPPGAESGFIEAQASPVIVDFAGGSMVELAPHGSLRVLESRQVGVDLLVERGVARISVVHVPDQRWTLRAGPYAVHVTGTRFEAGWDPEQARFELRLFEGGVDVVGPHLPGARRVVAGERLEVFPGDGRMTLSRVSRDGPAKEAESGEDGPAVESAVGSAERPEPSALASAVLGAAPPPAAGLPPWQAQARAGRYVEALAQVERQGFEAVLAGADREETRLLADAARFGGSPGQARRALVALRDRHGVRGETAYLLGKIAADQLGAPGEALRWFDTYLSELPQGPLREQALGRSMELQGQGSAGAKATARRYLAEYPEGAYAPLARSLVGRKGAR